MPIASGDNKYVHCPVCKQKFRFQYDATKHLNDLHPDQQDSQ